VTAGGPRQLEHGLVAVLHAGVVDDVLSEAMAPVLRDLQCAGIAAPRIEDREWTDDPGSPSAMLWSPGGNGSGVHVTRAAPEFERVAMVADQVQDWAIDELWGQAPTNWPPCPRHPSSHPMKVSTREAAAVWVCPADEAVILPVGEL
jgi:hypothetical protein